MGEILRAEGISYRYGDRIPALRDVSVSFSTGERVAVLGGNGAGKSTFFLCCNGVLRPQGGKLFFEGSLVTKAKKDVLALRQGVGLVFQEPDSQIIAGSVESEVSFGPMNLRLPMDEVSRRVDESLLQMNMEMYRDYAPQYLSGGEKKRVSIADILAMKPSMILFDEPTASLDPRNVAALESILDGLSEKGAALVVSTHDVDFAYRFAERAVVFADGEIIADAHIDQVFASEDTMIRAGLRKPLLYEAFDMLQAGFACKPGTRRPRTIEEFRLAGCVGG